jgi:hypothetical protein
MSDYLTNLLTRTRHPERMIQPRVSSRFAPVSPASMGGELSGWDAGEDPYQPVPLNPAVPRHDLSIPQFADALSQDRGEGELLPGDKTGTRGQLSMSTPDAVQWTASSDTESAATPNGLSSVASDQREAPSRNLSDAKAISLSPIDATVVADSPYRAGTRTAQEKPASGARSVAQSTDSPLRIPSEQMRTVEKGERSLLRDESSSESQDSPSVAPTAQAYDQRLNSSNTPAERGSALSSQQPLVGAPPARSDGKQLHRLPTIVSESGEALPEIRKQAAAGLNVSDISLDPSLVTPVRTTKGVAPSHHLMSSQPEDASGTVPSTLDQQELNATPRMSPKISNNFLARRRSVAPMTASSVSQLSAAERGRPVEPVVHVTIGRVEVRAVAPPVRQQKSPKPQSAMSLDDYLKRRGDRSGG